MSGIEIRTFSERHRWFLVSDIAANARTNRSWRLREFWEPSRP